MTVNRPFSLIEKFGNFLILAGLFLLAYQAYRWLQGGSWRFIPISSGLYYLNIEVPDFELPFLRRAIDWVLEIPMAIFLLVSGIALRLIEERPGEDG